MNNFNFNRFWQVLKWTILTEKKSIITAAIAFTVAFLAIQLFSCFTIFDISHGQGLVATYTGMGTCSAILSFMAAYYGSGILGNARSSQQRTTALMLPASNLEKFTARIVYCCIVMLAVLYLAVVAATGLRMLLELIAGHENIVSGLSILFGYDFEFNYAHSDLPISIFTIVMMYIWSASILVLGGVFFRKHPFVWTNVTMIVGSILLFTLVYYIVIMIGEENLADLLKSIFGGLSFETFQLISDFVLLAFTAFNFWLSYRLYTRLQVVQHKWFNV